MTYFTYNGRSSADFGLHICWLESPQIISHNCTSIRRFRLEDAVCTISE